VTVINPSTLTVIKDSVGVGKYPQGLAIANGKVFVCNAGLGSGTTVSVIDAATDAVIKTITVATDPVDIGVDGDGDVIVLSSGYSDYTNPANDTPGSIAVISSTTNSITATIGLPLAQYGHPGRLAVSKNGYGYFTGMNAVARFDTKTNTITNGAFIAGNYYSIAVDDVKDQVYVSDAKDYNQNGSVTIYDKSAVLVSSFTAGVIPGTIAFKR
jgi:YVTN family beta-propeller protein